MSEKRKDKYKKSKEEIAREFDLPERKSKIATILKQDGQAYCICRTSDSSRFMIGCDGCEEWYHGDCIQITEKEAKHIKHYYCQRCKENDSSLQTIFRATPAEKPTSSNNVIPLAPIDVEKRRKPKEQNSRDSSLSSSNVNTKKVNRCGVCEGCRAPNCNSCEACRIRVGHKPRCENRICVLHLKHDIKQEIKYKKKEKPPKERSRKRKRSQTPEVYINPELEGIRQCYGPGCRKNARPQSKYCSDFCGINLATNRIFQVLPQRVQEWNISHCRAEEENKKQLDQIRNKQAVVRFALAELDKRHRELDMIIERAKHSIIDPNHQDNTDIEDEQSMYCITCGHEIHSRTAIKHMEKCFNKYESQSSFGSIFKTRVEGNPMFCDTYNPISKTYCKRLRVLCPEHCKDAKVNDNDVCGCPLVTNVFNPTGEFCRAPKKRCFKHYVWEKIRRAEIDLERVRQWLKMDELLEQERQIRHNMASRAGVLGLLLHSTYNHEVMEELCRQQQQQQKLMIEMQQNQKQQEEEDIIRQKKLEEQLHQKTLEEAQRNEKLQQQMLRQQHQQSQLKQLQHQQNTLHQQKQQHQELMQHKQQQLLQLQKEQQFQQLQQKHKQQLLQQQQLQLQQQQEQQQQQQSQMQPLSQGQPKNYILIRKPNQIHNFKPQQLLRQQAPQQLQQQQQQQQQLQQQQQQQQQKTVQYITFRP